MVQGRAYFRERILFHDNNLTGSVRGSLGQINGISRKLTLGQRQWPWAQGRITAGHVLDLRNEPASGKFLLVFHGATARGRRERAHHGEASIGIAWSDDRRRWHWPSGRG